MTTKLKTKSRILASVHATASDMHRLGFIDQLTMHEFDAMCLATIPAYSSVQIRALRDRLQLSQSTLAAALHISRSTVYRWEIGDRHPNGPALKLLNLLDRKGLEAIL